MFISYADFPKRDYEIVALCRGPLDKILEGKKIRAERRNAKREGGPYRGLAIALPSGRYAQVVAYDGTPDSVEILLEMIDGLYGYRSDLKAVADLIGVRMKDFYWIASREQVLWRR